MALVYHFGILVPKDHQHVIELDFNHVRNIWHEAELEELKSLEEYEKPSVTWTLNARLSTVH